MNGAWTKYRLLTVGEYHRMAETGILSADERVELLNGQLIRMSPIGSKHSACVEKTDEFLKKALAGKAMVRTQNPVVFGDYSEPEPDVAVVQRKENYYADRHPLPDEIYLIIEISDSSLEIDRQVKLPIYAAARIPEYWILNLAKREAEVYQLPMDDQYRTRQIFRAGEEVTLNPFGMVIPLDSLFP